jgi:cyclopropane-fatty-acyl-phospholipid synthase
MLLAHLFERIVSVGRLRIVDAGGRSFAFEGSPGTSVAIRLHDPALHWKLLVRPRLFLPEAFVDGTLTIEEGSLYDLIDLMTTNIELLPEGFLGHHLYDDLIGFGWFIELLSVLV